MTFLTLKMTLNVADNDTIESILLKNPRVDPQLFFQPFQKSFRLKNGPKLAKFRNLTLNYDLFDLEMTSNVVDSDNVERAVLSNPYGYPELVSPAILQVILTQKWAKISKIQKFDLEI